MIIEFLFFFQAEDGIRDPLVTGVQTCALPICDAQSDRRPHLRGEAGIDDPLLAPEYRPQRLEFSRRSRSLNAASAAAVSSSSHGVTCGERATRRRSSDRTFCRSVAGRSSKDARIPWAPRLILRGSHRGWPLSSPRLLDRPPGKWSGKLVEWAALARHMRLSILLPRVCV